MSLPDDFQHALDHEHHVRPPGVVFVEAERDIVLERPRQDAVAEFGDLLIVLDDDGVLADQVDAADVAVEIDAHQGPIEPRRHLLDMGGLAGAVIAGDHHAAVLGEAGEDGERGRPVEPVIRVEVGHVLVGLGIGRHFHIAVDAEYCCRIDTFMSGRPATSCTAAVIDPPWASGPPEAPDAVRLSNGPADGGGNLADAKPAKNPAAANNTINYINEIAIGGPVRKAGLALSPPWAYAN